MRGATGQEGACHDIKRIYEYQIFFLEKLATKSYNLTEVRMGIQHIYMYICIYTNLEGILVYIFLLLLIINDKNIIPLYFGPTSTRYN